ncbi:hypothetical protein [Ahniella affigens]|nr:hypothetical protein [Ahniella affigens]
MNAGITTTESNARRIWNAVPDAVLAVLFLIITWSIWYQVPISGFWLGDGTQLLDMNHPMVLVILAIEAGFLLPQLTLTDVATRIRKRPPWWLIPPLAIGLIVLAPGGMEFVKVLLSNQPLLLVPALWSVFHRARQLWELPGTPALTRMRVRALVNGRANVGGVMIIVMLALSIANTSGWPFASTLTQSNVHMAVMAMLYFAATAFDSWRVGGAGFARSPKPLLKLDIIGVRDTDSLVL